MRTENVSVISADPFRCRMWQFHDRIEDYINEETCKDEINSFLERGQLLPVLGRRVQGDPDFDYELIYGARRLFVARHLNRLLLVEPREMSDREAAVALDIENRQRKDLSAYERSLCYARWLRAGYFSSQDEIVEALNISAAQVSRLLMLAQLPTVIVGAFESGLDIRERWGVELAEAIRDPNRRALIINRSRTISATQPRLPAREICRQLLAPADRGRRFKGASRDRVIQGRDGMPLFRIRRHRGSVVFIVPVRFASPLILQRIQRVVTAILSNELLHTRSVRLVSAPLPIQHRSRPADI